MVYKVPFVNYPAQYRKLEEEINLTIKKVLERGDLILRRDVEEFENEMASFLGMKYGVGVGSGTDALIFSLKAAGIGPGDEVITVSHTFVATVASIVHCGAKPVLVDVKGDFTMDMEKIEEAVTPKTKAVIAVHLNGHSCEMNKLMDVADRYNLVVIEDAAQALGAKFDSKMVGSFGLASCFSFYPAKILGSYGDGGLIATNNKNISEKARLLRCHGQKTKTEIACYGFTGRLDNLQAAILRIKFKYLPEDIKARRKIAKMYDEGLEGINQISIPFSECRDERYFDVYQNYVLMAQRRDELAEYLKCKGVETLIKDPIALHRQNGLGLSSFNLPFTEKLAGEVISVPMYPELTDNQVLYVVDCIREFYEK